MLSKMNQDIVQVKRRRLSGDERLNRSRERNRVHARKTRERKKSQTAALQFRINELYEEGSKLRQLIDERYTASSLLGLSSSVEGKVGESQTHLPSSQICCNYFLQVLTENAWLREGSSMMGLPYINIPVPPTTEKRVRRSGKYTPQERERIRRERNRMHAKKTRDRKKFFLETSRKIISEMEAEAQTMRTYLIKMGALDEEECQKYSMRQIEFRHELAQMNTNGSDQEGDEEDSTSSAEGEEEMQEGDEGEDEREEVQSGSGSDENEKVSSWSGSNDGSSSSNPTSSNNGSNTSGEEMTSNNSSSRGDMTSNQSTNISHSNNSSSAGKRYMSVSSDNSNSDDRDSPEQYHRNTNVRRGSESGFDEFEPIPANVVNKESYLHGLPHMRRGAMQGLDSLAALASVAMVASTSPKMAREINKKALLSSVVDVSTVMQKKKED